MIPQLGSLIPYLIDSGCYEVIRSSARIIRSISSKNIVYMFRVETVLGFVISIHRDLMHLTSIVT